MKTTRDMVRTAKKLSLQIKELETTLSELKTAIKENAAADGVTEYTWSDIGVKLIHSNRVTISAKELEKVAPAVYQQLAHFSEVTSLKFI